MFHGQRLPWLVACASVWFFTLGIARGGDRSQKSRPNIVLVMVDDMGWSDLGCYGGEINTPHIDALAADGVRFSQAYNCAKCETTRATLLSGRYAPEVGIGRLRDSVTLAELLGGAGYTTLMTGKWHMSGNPIDRGFDRYFGHLSDFGPWELYNLAEDRNELDNLVDEHPEQLERLRDQFDSLAKEIGTGRGGK